MKILLFAIFNLLIANAFAGHERRYVGGSCVTPLTTRGTCVSLKFCPEVLTLYQRLGTNDATQYSRRLQQLCGFALSDNYPVVCCMNPVYLTDMMTNTFPFPTTALPTTAIPTTALPTTTPAPIITSTIPVTSSSTTISTTTMNDLIKSDAINATTTSQCYGVCKPLDQCNSLYTAISNDRYNITLHNMLRASNSICIGFGRTAVCCPDDVNNVEPPRDRASSTAARLPTEEDGCGFVRVTFNKVVGGEESQLGAWPWMTLIGYNRYSTQPFKCGGTLITAGHVLTAAHCIRGDLSFVRLGEHNVSDLYDVEHVDIDVRRMVQHPNYATRNNTARRYDLAILFLSSNVDFNDRIRPICMPMSAELRSRKYVGSLPYVAGWGRTAENGPTSDVLQELQIPVVENAECERRYKAAGAFRGPEQFDASVMCAGQVVGSDSCKGDSGGPLMIPHLYKQIVRYYQLGIVSYGIGCAQGIPGVYTSTQYFIDWIQEMVATS